MAVLTPGLEWTHAAHARLRGRALNYSLRVVVAAILILTVAETTLIQALPRVLPNSVEQRNKESSVPIARTDDFIADLSHRSFRYFLEQSDPETGLVLDRARTDGTPSDENHRTVASIAATGFGLTGLCIAAEHSWIKSAEARDRARASLKFFAEHAFQEHGWFYHWMDYHTGERLWNSEISSIDTALLLAGILTVRQYFHEDQEIVRAATKIYERVDFQWMLNDDHVLLSHGWKPESGFLGPRWDNYNEDLILYLLAIGSPTHPIPARSWYAVHRTHYQYQGYSYFTTIGVPLFMHQYSHAWVDFRRRRESRGHHIDYFQNSIEATLAHRQYCIDLAREFSDYGPNIWGISASDSMKGYIVWDGPPRDPQVDGTVVPSAAAGSLMFTPELSLAALKEMRSKYGDRIYGRYGFTDAFNPLKNWVNPDVIGIDQGIMLLSAENARTQNVWRWFMRNKEIIGALEQVGLKRYRKPARKAA